MLEVGWFRVVWYSGTSLACLKPYRQFFVMTAIPVCRNGSFVATKCIVKISHTCFAPIPAVGELTVLPQNPSWLGEGEGWKEEGEGMERRREGE